MNQPVQLILIGEFGVLIHSLIKAKSLKKDYSVANEQFSFWRNYILADTIGVILAILSPIAWWLIYNEVAANYEAITTWTRCTFLFVGLGGSYGLQLLDNTSKKYIRKVIDAKTNIADEVTGDKPTNP